jgi:hypothetical protein
MTFIYYKICVQKNALQFYDCRHEYKISNFPDFSIMVPVTWPELGKPDGQEPLASHYPLCGLVSIAV